MFADWIIQKTGMVLAFFVMLGVFYQATNFYENYSARREASTVAQELADQISQVANAAPEYSVGSAFSKKIYFLEEIHETPYIFKFDVERQNIRITLISRNISEFAILPRSTTVNDMGYPCLVKEGFNSNGEASVGADVRGMNRSRGISITKSQGANYTIKISAMI